MCGVVVLLIAPPIWMIEAAKVNIAQAPQTGTYITKTTEEIKAEELYSARNASESELKQVLQDVSTKYGQDYKELERVINCESGWKINALGKAGEIGLAQFMKATWNYFNLERGLELNIENPFEQLEMIAWAFSTNKQSHWTCFYLMHY